MNKVSWIQYMNKEKLTWGPKWHLLSFGPVLFASCCHCSSLGSRKTVSYEIRKFQKTYRHCRFSHWSMSGIFLSQWLKYLLITVTPSKQVWCATGTAFWQPYLYLLNPLPVYHRLTCTHALPYVLGWLCGLVVGQLYCQKKESINSKWDC